MANINDNIKQGIQGSYDRGSQVSQAQFMLDQTIQKNIQTSYLARIDSCKSAEELAGAGTVCITPLTSQTDTEGTALDMVSIPEIPHTRYQYGIAAVIIDPVPGDIVAVNVCKNDISTIKQGTKEPVNAGSYRQFSQSDSIAGSSVHTQTPEIYTVYRQDKTMKTRAPEGIRIETDKTLDEYAGENRTIEIGQNRSETIGANSDITIQGNATLVVNGDNSISINGSQSQNIGGSVSITIGGTLTIKAPSITFDTPQAKFTGNVTIAGGLSQGGGTANGRDAVFNNNIITKQTLTAQTDVIGGGISLKSHTHMEQGDGAPTSPPQ